MDPAARILDANANRAAEALRTLEDVARFGMDDPGRSAALKGLRHAVAAALDRLPPGWLAANRDTPGDVGRSSEGAGEYRRDGLVDVAAAASKRLGQALRVLEEVAKTVDGELARAIERLRYQGYAVAAEVVARAPGRRREQWRVCVLVTESLCRRPWQDVVRAAIDGGADCLQLREKSLDAGELLARAAWIVSQARPRGVRTIVNDRPDIALLANADGVHVGQEDLPPSAVRQLAGTRLTIGMSTHDLAEAERAVAEGADYCGVGAMFATSVKPEVRPAGPESLRRFVASHPSMPHLAIGGITPSTLPALLEVGCRGVAVSGCVCGAEHPDRVVASLRGMLAASVAEASP